jgi:hypothetical protein
MTGEMDFSARISQPMPDAEQIAQDANGDVCDEWVGRGFRFEMREDGRFGIAESEHSELPNVATILHNPDLVEEILDHQGKAVPAVTPNTLSQPAGFWTGSSLRRLMAELPADFLVYDTTTRHGRSVSQTKGPEPVGIRLAAVPEVRDRVREAYTSLPRYRPHYPPGALVLRDSIKWDLLKGLNAVLTPPQPVAKAPSKAAPKVSQAPREQVVPLPPVTPPQPETPTDWDYFRAGSRAFSYVFTFLSGVGTLATIQDYDAYGTTYPELLIKDGGITGICGGLALLAYFGTRIKR